MKRMMVVAAAALAVAAGAVAAPTLTVLPSSSISVTPGSTVGWGYSITNDDATHYYVPSALSAPSFSIGTPVDIFDYPIIAPGATATENYNGVMGLLKLIVSPLAAPGTVDSGVFILSGDYWSGNPATDSSATIVAAAPSAFAPVSADVAAPSGVPEPSTFAALALGLVAVSTYRRYAATVR